MGSTRSCWRLPGSGGSGSRARSRSGSSRRRWSRRPGRERWRSSAARTTTRVLELLAADRRSALPRRGRRPSARSCASSRPVARRPSARTPQASGDQRPPGSGSSPRPTAATSCGSRATGEPEEVGGAARTRGARRRRTRDPGGDPWLSDSRSPGGGSWSRGRASTRRGSRASSSASARRSSSCRCIQIEPMRGEDADRLDEVLADVSSLRLDRVHERERRRRRAGAPRREARRARGSPRSGQRRPRPCGRSASSPRSSPSALRQTQIADGLGPVAATADPAPAGRHRGAVAGGAAHGARRGRRRGRRVPDRRASIPRGRGGGARARRRRGHARERLRRAQPRRARGQVPARRQGARADMSRRHRAEDGRSRAGGRVDGRPRRRRGERGGHRSTLSSLTSGRRRWTDYE